MAQLLSLSRAARLAGVSRGELQHRIRSQGVQTFEGQIPVDTLLLLYPQLDLQDDPVLERLERLKAAAQPKPRQSDGWLPEPEVLMGRLHEFSRLLVKTKAALNVSQELLREIRDRLRRREPDSDIAEVLAHVDQALSGQAPAEDPSAQLFAKNILLNVMTASVKVMPSGHEFFVEGNETILEAGLKAGLHLDYGCSSGNCGACRAHVVSGDVRKVRDHDFVLSEREQGLGLILTCSWTAVTDVVLEAREARSTADLPPQTIRSKAVKVEPVSEDMAVLHLRTPRTQTLRFMAGQSVRLTDEDGQQGEYVIASCPCDGRNLEFLIRRRVEDPFARTLFERRIKNQVIEGHGPFGDFVLKEDSSQPAVFVAIGPGFAAIKSLLEHAIASDAVEHLHLYRLDDPLSRSRVDNLCRAWADSLDNFSFTLMAPDLPASEAFRRIAADLPDLASLDIYLAGPRGQTEAFLDAAGRVGLDADRIHFTCVD